MNALENHTNENVLNSDLSDNSKVANDKDEINNTSLENPLHKVTNGVFTAVNCTLDETAINELVLRVHLNRIKQINSENEKHALRVNKVSSFGRKILEKKFSDEDSAGSTMDVKSFTKLTHYVQSPRKRKYVLNGISTPKMMKLNNHSPDNTKKIKNTPMSEIINLPKFNKVINEPHYFLTFKRLKYVTDGKLNYNFQQLVNDVKSMKLPSVNWKIKIIVRKKEISSIVFTNKQDLERNVSFSVKSDVYDIIIDNKPALLLGAPLTLDCIEDVEILLDVIHNISAECPMILYK